MSGLRIRRLAPMLAVTGVIAGHELVYRAVFPDPSERTAALAASGHGYWATAVHLGVACAIAALAVVIAGNLRPGAHGAPGVVRSRRLLRSGACLAALQVVGFVVLEVVERSLAGAPISGIFSHSLIIAATGVQLVVALALASLWALVAWLALQAASGLATGAVARMNEVSGWSAASRLTDLSRAACVSMSAPPRGPPLLVG